MIAVVNVHTTPFPTGDSYTITLSLEPADAIRLLQADWLGAFNQRAAFNWAPHKIRLTVRVSGQELEHDDPDTAAEWAIGLTRALLA